MRVRRDTLPALRLIGLAGQHAAIEPATTGRENLHMVARLYGRTGTQVGRAADLVHGRFGLGAVGDQLVRAYSGGMRLLLPERFSRCCPQPGRRSGYDQG